MRIFKPIILVIAFLLNQEAHAQSADPQLAETHFQLAQDSLVYSYWIGKSHLESAIQNIPEQGNDSLASAIYQYYGALLWAHSDYPRARLFLRKSNQKNTPFTKLRATTYNTLGLSYYYTSDYKKALINLDSALLLFESIQDTNGISRVLNNRGLVFKAVGDFEQSTKNIVESIQYEVRYIGLADHYYGDSEDIDFYKNEWLSNEIYIENQQVIKESNDPKEISRALQKVGTLLQMYDQIDSSLHYLHQAYELNSSKGFIPRLALDCIDLGNGYLKKGDTASAINYYLEANRWLLQEHMFPSLGSTYMQLGDLQNAMGAHDEALRYYKEIREMSDTLGHRAGVSEIDLAIATVYQGQNKMGQAINQAKQAYALAKFIGSFEWIKKSDQKLANLYEAIGDYPQALIHQRNYHLAQLKTLDAENEKTEKSFVARFELEEKSKEINKLSRESLINRQEVVARTQWLITALILLIVSSGFLVVFMVQNRKVKTLNRKIATKSRQNETLVKEIHHRVKNNLQMISSMLAMQGRRKLTMPPEEFLKITQTRIQSISLIHDHLYHHHSLDVVDLKVFIRDLVSMIANAYPLKSSPTIKYKVDPIQVNIDVSTIIGLMLHELVNNSFKYALGTTDNPQLRIHCIQVNKSICLEVSDNGMVDKAFTRGFGWHIIEVCLESVNGTYHVESDNGFKAVLEFELPQTVFED